ncbi:MAG: ABC transporter permease [Acidobacteriota bacterium]|nr:ABC transporter permease [Acidobacteriota bacterium]
MIEWYQDLLQAIDELANQKLRTLLTLLGMIFGVGAVIAMLSVGEGAEREALQIIDTMGLRNILVKSKPTPDDMLAEIREESMGLNLQDLEAARDTLPFLTGYTALKRVRIYSQFSQFGKSDAQVLGVSPTHFDMANLEVAGGRPLTQLDAAGYAQNCVIGPRTAHDLFGNRDPIGGMVKVNHLWFTVVGVLADNRTEQTEFEGVKLQSNRNKIFVPIETALKRFQFKTMEEELDEFHIQLAEGVDSNRAAQTLSRLLTTRHRGVDDFELVVPEALLEQHRKTQNIFNIVMSAIAGISLLVGGIGIMNIMLANVLERTREIGIRRAIGATQKDIQRLFLIEAFAISFFGGLLGILLGFLIARVIAAYSGWATAWSSTAVVLSVGVCAAIGLVFGIYPAMKAARLDPIEALRHD